MTTATGTPRGQRMMQTLAHELRNPLASLQGCAYTLQESFEDLSPSLRRQLVEVVVKQSKRLDWLIGAVAIAGGGMPARKIGRVETGRLIEHASGSLPSKPSITAPVSFIGDEGRIRIALEALFAALYTGPEKGKVTLQGDRLEVQSSLGAVASNRRWKVDVARDLLRAEGCRLRVGRTSSGIKATIRFPRKEVDSRRIA